MVYRLRRQFRSWDRATLERHQRDRVGKLLEFVGRNSPYYAAILSPGCTLDAAPVIDKSVMMANFDAINTAGLKRDDLVAFRIAQERLGNLALFDDAYSVGLSSGTSGNRGLTVLSRAEMEGYGSLIAARSGLPRGIGPIRLLFTLRTNNPAFMQAGSFWTKIFFADYTHPAEELIDLMNEKRINVLAGPPSLLRMVAARSRRLARPLSAVISYAEVLDGHTRRALERDLQAPIVQIYQCSEGFIASTCCCGNLHVNEDIILIEPEDIHDAEGKVCNVVLTDLYRTTQPIIRYRLGDLLEFDPDPCPCGSCFRRIKVIHGRSDDIFHLRGADGKLRYLFPDYVCRSINQASEDIVEFQAIQHAPDDIEIRLVTVPGANRTDIEQTVLENLRWRADKVGGQLGTVRFTASAPERNPRSFKLIRVVRRF
jgi:putative adenylate-forming enzyme